MEPHHLVTTPGSYLTLAGKDLTTEIARIKGLLRLVLDRLNSGGPAGPGIPERGGQPAGSDDPEFHLPPQEKLDVVRLGAIVAQGRTGGSSMHKVGASDTVGGTRGLFSPKGQPSFQTALAVGGGQITLGVMLGTVNADDITLDITSVKAMSQKDRDALQAEVAEARADTGGGAPCIAMPAGSSDAPLYFLASSAPRMDDETAVYVVEYDRVKEQTSNDQSNQDGEFELPQEGGRANLWSAPYVIRYAQLPTNDLFSSALSNNNVMFVFTTKDYWLLELLEESGVAPSHNADGSSSGLEGALEKIQGGK